jgi:hypothetical protein
LETGRVVTSGAARDLVNDPIVSETFLGGRPRGAGVNTAAPTSRGSVV